LTEIVRAVFKKSQKPKKKGIQKSLDIIFKRWHLDNHVRKAYTLYQNTTYNTRL